MENSRREVALCAATALAMPTARAFMARNAICHPLLLIRPTMSKNALPAWSSGKEVVFGMSMPASQVWLMKKKATRKSPPIMAIPAERCPPLLSSERVAMPSKPRKDRTAIDSAVPTRGAEKLAASKIGLAVTCAPPVPWTMATTAMTAKMTRKSTSAVRKSRLTTAVKEMPT